MLHWTLSSSFLNFSIHSSWVVSSASNSPTVIRFSLEVIVVMKDHIQQLIPPQLLQHDLHLLEQL